MNEDNKYTLLLVDNLPIISLIYTNSSSERRIIEIRLSMDCLSIAQFFFCLKERLYEYKKLSAFFEVSSLVLYMKDLALFYLDKKALIIALFNLGIRT